MKKYKLCQKCSKEVGLSTKTCTCGSEKFAPTFVKKIEKLSRQFSVQVTEPNKKFYKDKKPPDKRVTLYKWWLGGKSSLHINTVEEWNKIKEIIDERLSGFLNWKSKAEILAQIKDTEKQEKKSGKQIEDLTRNYPEFIRNVLKKVDYSKIDPNNATEFGQIVKDLTEVLSKTDQDFGVAFRNVIKQLPKQPKRALEDLDELLKTWSLRQITSLSSQVINRLETLKLFKERILDDKTYEIRGDNSIHRILESSMWMIDERYWLLYSNETLRKIVEKELPKKDKKYSKLRPDFVCGTVDNKLIIVELKRPSHALTIEDLNQAETYLSIIEEHGKKFSSSEVYLIGRKIDDDLSRKIKHRASHFKIKTFSDLIDDTEKRYKEFMDIIKK
ncbi:MAG: hypothetical protein AAB510_01755 [Patescibacteria group bacterium]